MVGCLGLHVALAARQDAWDKFEACMWKCSGRDCSPLSAAALHRQWQSMCLNVSSLPLYQCAPYMAAAALSV